MKDILQIEQLYYVLQLDVKGLGLQRWLELSELGNENINKLLPGEIRKYLSPKHYDDATLARVHSKIAEMERNAGHIRQALGHWGRVKQLGEANQREDWIVDALIGLFNCRWPTEPEEALRLYLQPAREICEKRFPEELALVYYEIGFAYRQMQDLIQALEWYEKALQKFRESPDDTHLDGILLNDTGYAYLHLGRSGQAAKYLKEALDLREERLHSDERRLRDASPEDVARLRAARNQSSLFVGLSRNTLGEYHRYVNELDESLKDYDEAYKQFVEVNDYYWQAKCLCARGEASRRLAWHAWERGRDPSFIQPYTEQAQEDIETSLYLCEKYQLDDERDTAYRRLGRLSHDHGLIAQGQNNLEQAREKLEEAYQLFRRGLEFARKTRETLEELENLTELAFLADDAIDIYGNENVPEHYRGAVKELEKALKKHKNDPQRIYQYPVFEALMKMEQAAIAYAEGDIDKALKGYVEAYRGLGTFPGYGHARYSQHFGHLTRQIENLPKDEQVHWCKRFIDVWKKTVIPGRERRTLAEDLLPDLVKWCNKRLKGLDNH